MGGDDLVIGQDTECGAYDPDVDVSSGVGVGHRVADTGDFDVEVAGDDTLVPGDLLKRGGWKPV